MTSSTCWISRRIQHSGVLMISSTFQPLLWRTCGLFDNDMLTSNENRIQFFGSFKIVQGNFLRVPGPTPTNPTGFAGGDQFITSPGPNASSDIPRSFELVNQSSIQNHGEPSLKAESQHMKNTHSWNVLDEFDDLSDDPLGDDSMEAFINLEKFLDENSLFDEDGNLTIHDNENDFCVPNMEAEVKPVITLAPEPESAIPQFHLMEVVPTPAPTQTLKSPAKRKRAARSKEGVKTSLFEISAVPVRESEKDSVLVTMDSELDHDYSFKRQRLSSSGSTSSDTKRVNTTSEPRPSTSTYPEAETESVFDESMDKHTIRRIKNNHASKRSREQRKQKFVDMDVEAEELVIKNQELREKIVELENLAKEMKQVLVAKMTGKG